MVHALLPGMKTDWNVVYLKHSRLPQKKSQDRELLLIVTLTYLPVFEERQESGGVTVAPYEMSD